MSLYQVLQTEKSYRAQLNNTYVISFKDKSFQPNKIEVAKLLSKEGFHPLSVTVVNPRSKMKRRGGTSRLVKQTRPRKYYVKLQAGETLTPDTEEPTDNTSNQSTN